MSAQSPIGEYRPSRAPLHRVRAGAKLLGLFCFAIVVVWTSGVLSTSLALGAAVALTVLAGMRGSDFLRIARGFALIALILFAFQVWQQGWLRGYEVVGDLLALILAANAVTASTRVDDMLQAITFALKPLRPLGVQPERIALMFSLMLRSIPTILGIAQEASAAAKARGLERNPRALVVPLAVRTVAHAQLTGEALAARGLGDDDTL